MKPGINSGEARETFSGNHSHTKTVSALCVTHVLDVTARREGSCKRRPWPVSLDQAAGWNQHSRDKATIELGLPGI